MRIRGTSIQQFLLGLALLAALCWNIAHASEIKGLRLVEGAAGTRAELAMPAGTDYKLISLANPDRLVVDLPGVDLGPGLAMPAPAGLIKAVRSGHPVAGTTRIVFDLASAVVALTPRVEIGPGGSTLVLEWPGDAKPDAIARIVAAAQAKTPPAAKADPSNAPALVATGEPSQAATGASPAGEHLVDPGVASAQATSRLVAATVAAPPLSVKVGGPLPAVVVPASSDDATASAVVSVADLPSVSQAPGRVATGVPTRIATGVAAPVTPSVESAPQPARPPRSIGMRPLIVAIDPGHGGQDPGAIGLQGKREKDVTLAIGRELARQINATPGLKAYMTRDSDVFIPLNRRAQLARAAHADIFVSVHADAAENRSARGSSVYVLSLKGASSQRARWLADKENSADLIGGRVASVDNTLASVLLDLTQSGHMKASEDAADHVLIGLREVGNNHKPQIERANFAVLRTSDMPAMLVETAFISNPDEERRLTDPAAQRELARAILGGIDGYFQRQPPPGTLYASRAAAGARSGGGSP